MSFVTFGHGVEASQFCRCQLNLLLVTKQAARNKKTGSVKRKLKTMPFAVALYMEGGNTGPRLACYGLIAL